MEGKVWTKAAGETPSEARHRYRQFQALLAQFVKGDILVQGVHVKVLRPTDIAFRNIIEFRSGPPDPQTRMFCFVYCPGVWVCTGLHLRSELGDLGDPRWLTAAEASNDAWRAAFGQQVPHPATFPCDTKLKLRALLDG